MSEHRTVILVLYTSIVLTHPDPSPLKGRTLHPHGTVSPVSSPLKGTKRPTHVTTLDLCIQCPYPVRAYRVDGPVPNTLA